VPHEHKAGALGPYAAIVGIGLLPASIIARLLWKATNYRIFRIGA